MILNSQNMGNRWKIRRDGEQKVTGSLQYLTDLYFPEMLYGSVLRSEYPHAEVLFIDTQEAEALPGVVAVITYRDVPGLNGFGIVIQDQPVLCEDKVRYVGDAIAAVAAETKEIAEQALALIQVKYKVLEPITDPELSLLENTTKLHPNGNLLHSAIFEKGSLELEPIFSSCNVVVEDVYETPRQMHVYMETEGGVAVPEKNGELTIYAPTQHGFKDQLQLSRILNIPKEKIRVISSPIGGSFGGKDELNIQPYISILALKTGKPVKIHQSRRMSVLSSIKRHPMKIYMKTGADSTGKIVAHQVKIIADTGAYATLGPAVLDFAVEHSAGPYRMENILVEGFSVYTNNGVAGEFRGFGGNQITFALETQIERLAEKLKMDCTMVRERNIRNQDDLGPVEQEIVPTNGAKAVLKEILKSPILANKDAKKASSEFIIKGTGYSITMHGGGLGYGRPDPSGARLSLNKEGKLEVSFGFEECGQGLITSIEMIMTETFQCSSEDIEIIIGDTSKVPHSGSSTASRSTSMVWLGINKLKEEFTDALLVLAQKFTSLKKDTLYLGKSGVWAFGKEQEKNSLVVTYKQLAETAEVLPLVTTNYHFPTTPNSIDGGHYLYTFAGVACEVEIDVLTGRVVVTKMDHAISAGPIVNPMGYLGQIEGGASMGLGFTLMEDAVMENSRYMVGNLDNYLIPTIMDIPKQTNVIGIEELLAGDEFGPRGVGEIGTVAVAPAIISAIHQATNVWITKLPINTSDILAAVKDRFII
ncbi:xanthine dehydrogenase subunit D [Bacillus sp. B1-b2]|uniref:xanthine dehydrogenase subunit D n=1 Tax=Bacillus sp. B1-b2 TaxID=2653201 RepID=UPI001261F2E1|nr:xanthine dehydrogenase subunit D [Bacillus sp. B1-b2]KAB7671157.1 xanthine dehydrogenase subunit D [Bacillus sp. B1-b2]